MGIELDHFLTFRPVFRLLFPGDAKDSNFMTFSVKFLHSRVICVLMRHEKSAFGRASIRVQHICKISNMYIHSFLAQCSGIFSKTGSKILVYRVVVSSNAHY